MDHDVYSKDNYNDRQLLYRIDERTTILVSSLASFKEDLHLLQQSLEKKFVSRDEFRPIKERYVSRDEFQPIKIIVYGLVSIIMTSVVGAILVLVLKNPPN